jgi:hypothetical protein
MPTVACLMDQANNYTSTLFINIFCDMNFEIIVFTKLYVIKNITMQNGF